LIGLIIFSQYLVSTYKLKAKNLIQISKDEEVTVQRSVENFKGGFFKIHHRNSDNCLSMSGKNQNLVQARCGDSDNSSLWKIVGDEIHSYLGDFALTVSGGSTQKKAKVVLQPSTGLKYQKWNINSSEDHFTIIDKNSGLCLDVPGNKGDKGLNIEVYECLQNNNQAWVFARASPSAFPKKDKAYNIQNIASRKCFQNKGSGSELQQEDCSMDDNQKFFILPNSNGFYNIVSASNTDTYMSATGGNKKDPIKLLSKGSSEQNFSIYPWGGSAYYFKSQNGKCVDVPGGRSNNGLRMESYDCWDTRNQGFIIEEAGSFEETHPNTEWFRLYHLETDRCLVNDSDSSQIIQSQCNSNDLNSLWKFSKKDDGSFAISSFTGKLMDSAKWNNKGHLQLTTNGANWSIEKKYLNSYKFKSTNNMCIDVPGGGNGRSLGMEVYGCWNTNNQVFDVIRAAAYDFPNEDKIYEISNLASSRCVYYQGEGAEIVQRTCKTNDDNSKWKLKKTGNNQFFFHSFNNPNAVMTIQGSGTNNKTPFVAASPTDGNHQKFTVYSWDHTHFYIRDSNASKCMDVPGGRGNENLRMELYDCWDTKNQGFTIRETVPGYDEFLAKHPANKWFRIVRPNSSACLSHSRKSNGQIIHTICNDNDNSILWKFQRNSDKSYNIVNFYGGNFDVENSNYGRKTKVLVSPSTNNANQKFSFEKVGESWKFKVSSKDYCVDTPNGHNGKNTLLEIYDCWDTNNQKYNTVEDTPSSFPDPSKYYELKNLSSGMCLFYAGEGSEIVQRSCSSSNDSSKFRFEKIKENVFRIQSGKNSENFLDVSESKTGNKTPILGKAGLEGAANQQFTLYGWDESNFYIRGTQSDRCLDIPNGSKTENLRLEIYGCWDSKNQAFGLNEVDPPTPIVEPTPVPTPLPTPTPTPTPTPAPVLPIIDGGYYRIINNGNNKCVTYNYKNGQIIQLNCNDNWNFNLWKFVKIPGTIYWKIVSPFEDQVLTVKDGKTDNNSPVITYGYNDWQYQKWTPHFNNGGDKVFTIIDSNSYKCLDVPAALPHDFLPLSIYDCNKAEAQNFRLEPVEKAPFNMTDFYDKKPFSIQNTNSKLCIGVTSDLKVVLIDCKDQKSNLWYWIYVPGNGSIAIQKTDNQKVWKVLDGKREPGTQVMIDGYNPVWPYEHFYILYASPSSYIFRDANSGLCISAGSGELKIGTILSLATCDFKAPGQIFGVNEYKEDDTNNNPHKGLWP